nr:recombinase family protein [Peribacillus simplex]
MGVGYARTSSPSNPKESIPNQINTITNYCEENGIILLDIFVDEAKTGTRVENRDEYIRFKETIQTQPIDIVLVSFSNRLGRESFEIAMTLDGIINKKQIEFISITEGIGGRRLTPLEIATLSVHAESENTARRRVTQEARNIAIRNGIFAYGSVPFGYTKDLNGFLVPIKKEAVVVKIIFEKYLENKSTTKIASELMEEGHKKSDGSPLTANHVGKILSNKTYTGIIHRKTRKEKPFSKVRVQLGNEPATEIQHQAIISEDVFELAQQIKEKRKKPKENRFHFLSKILYCPICNSLMYGNYRRNRYECKQRNQGRYKCPFINKPEIDSAVLKFLKSFEDDQETVEKQLKTENKTKENERLIYLKEQNQTKFATGKINFELYLKTDDEISRKLQQDINLKFSRNRSRITMIDNLSEFIAEDNLEELHRLMLNKQWKLTYDSNRQIVKLN